MFSLHHLFPGLESFFGWCFDTWAGEYVRGSTQVFPLIETIHILAFVVLLGTILMVNLRPLGMLRDWSVNQIGRELAWYMRISLGLVILTGIPLFLSEAMKSYSSEAFGPKMILLALAVLYQYLLYPRLVTKPLAVRPAAILSLALWFGIGVAGRAIGFV